MVSDLFDPEYGRKTAALGVDAPLSANGIRTAVPYSAVDPATEYLSVAQRRRRRRSATHTDLAHHPRRHVSHGVPFEGFDVQVLQRARREGEARAPDPGELGWKDTVRVDPLESVRSPCARCLPRLPFGLPASARSLDITCRSAPTGAFTQLDALTAEPLQPTVVNATADLSFEASLEHPPRRRRGEPHGAAPRAAGDHVGAGGLTATAGERRRVG